jgi:curved DNA-binding protein CbpA
MSNRQSPNAKDENCYDVLGVHPTASDIDIKLAYRQLVQYWHPDKQFHEPEIAEYNLKKINDAYSKIKTPLSRKQYNQIIQLQGKINALSYLKSKGRFWGKFWTWLTLLESNKK